MTRRVRRETARPGEHASGRSRLRRLCDRLARDAHSTLRGRVPGDYAATRDHADGAEIRTWGVVAIVVAALAALAAVVPSAAIAAPGEGCSNEQVRAESNVNPTTGAPYSLGLPECRAYEMVSPLEKQQHDALTLREPSEATPVAPGGNAIKWEGQGDYAGAENYQVDGASPTNPYVALRTGAGWRTRSAYPPPRVIGGPIEAFGNSAGVYSPDLETEAVCGTPTVTAAEAGPALRCALRDQSGTWTSTPDYTDLTNEYYGNLFTIGASRNGEVYVFHGAKGAPFVSADTSSLLENCNGRGTCGGIYEMTGIGTQSPALRLVNVEDNGDMIGPENGNALGAPPGANGSYGGVYQAISEDGSKIFFTATPSGGVPTLYARVDGTETVAISNPSPSECTTCNAALSEGRYQGASANGEKVFFITEQQLLNSDTDSGNDLYEYDFTNPGGHELVQISGGGLGDLTPGSGADVQGVVAVSEDGSHIYFVAGGVLTSLPNGLGQTATNAADNLYAYDTDNGETKFVATLLESDKQLWGESELSGAGTFDTHLAQTTPNGRYLVCDTSAELITSGSEADTSGAQQVYRYDYQTGKIIRVSTGHEGFAENGNVPGFNAVIAPANDRGRGGAEPTANESDRTISENGETVAFVTAAQLQSTDVASGGNKSCNNESPADGGAGCEVYVWHQCGERPVCPDGDAGEVTMISEGQNPEGTVYVGMSATGSDIFFQTRTQLVVQDTDELGDIYDARIDGGFPAPAPEPSCSEEACQGNQSPPPTFSVPATIGFTGDGNQTAPPFSEPGVTGRAPKTDVQRLAEALKLCRRDKSKHKRRTCEKVARKKYAPKGKPGTRH
jgi:hypothetical protein